MRECFKFLNLISKLGSFCVAFSLLFLMQKYTIGSLFNFRQIVLFEKIYLYEIIFTLSSILIIKKHVKLISPYEKFISKC